MNMPDPFGVSSGMSVAEGSVRATELIRRPLFPIASALVSRLSTYLVLILAARLLDPEAFGAFAVLAAVATIANAAVSGGGDMWLNRFTLGGAPHLRRAPRLWRYYVIIAATLAGVMLAAAAAASEIPVFRPYRTAILLAMGWAAAAGMAEALLAIVRASGRTRLFFVLRDFAAPLSILAAVAVLRPMSADALLSVFVVVWAAVLAALAAFLVAKRRAVLPKVRGRQHLWRKVATHTVGLVYGNLGSRLSIYIDVLVLTWAISLTEIGEYRVAAQIAIGFIVVQHFVFLSLPWQMRQIGTPTNPGEGHAWVVWRQRALLGMALTALVVLCLLAEPLLSLFGERFVKVAPLFQLLLVVRFIDLLWGPQHEVLVSNGHIVEDAHANILALAGWLVAFASLQSVTNPIAAAVVANVASSIIGHRVRYRMIEQAELRHGAGHALGPALPIGLNAATAAAALFVL